MALVVRSSSSSSASSAAAAALASGSSSATPKLVAERIAAGAALGTASMRDPESAAAIRRLDQALLAIQGDVQIDAVAFADPVTSGIGHAMTQQAQAEKEAAEDLIEQELRTLLPKDYLASLGPEPNFGFINPGTSLGDEMARVEAGLPPPPLRLAVPGPPPPGAAPSAASEAWVAACEPLQSRAEELSGQALAIAAMERYGAEAWTGHTAELRQQTRCMAREAAELRRAADAVNALRKDAGRTLAGKLVRMRARRDEASGTIAALEVACATLQSKRAKQNPGLSADDTAPPAAASSQQDAAEELGGRREDDGDEPTE